MIGHKSQAPLAKIMNERKKELDTKWEDDQRLDKLVGMYTKIHSNH